MTLVIAHRGSRGTHPENTLPAFQEALQVKADGIELDVHLTKDQELVVIHDETVDRTTNGYGEIQELTLTEIKELDAGSWFSEKFKGTTIPTLQEVLMLLETEKFKGLLNIEIKTDKIQYAGIEAKIAALMKQQVWDFEYLYSSFHFPSLELIAQYDEAVPRAFIMYNSPKKVKKAEDSDLVTAFHPKMTWVVDHLTELGQYHKLIRPWTVNEEAMMQICFRHKLAGIHTDYPKEALRIRNLMQLGEGNG